MKQVWFDLAGRKVIATVRARHRDGTVTVEPCAGEWMGVNIRVPETATLRVESAAVERAYQLDAQRYPRAV